MSIETEKAMSCYKCGAECDGAECDKCIGGFSVSDLSVYCHDAEIDFTRVKTLPELLQLLNTIQIIVDSKTLNQKRLEGLKPYLRPLNQPPAVQIPKQTLLEKFIAKLLQLFRAFINMFL